MIDLGGISYCVYFVMVKHVINLGFRMLDIKLKCVDNSLVSFVSFVLLIESCVYQEIISLKKNAQKVQHKFFY